ncbi:hypothetical protein RhiirA5_405890 [Rhizophagus irregularis]|uniref:Uncharacterized protein n=1 Tax=Rhizophagus irregularis TaxID=588596 RepID=A0A2N0QEA8_9GLOM|nr:hypothetical protein RhiirA5_405890 [Rhizophagus irregularis]
MLRKYHPSAFRGYLAKYAKNLQKIYGSQKEFLTFQAEYPAFVHLALNPGTSKKEIEQIRREYIDSYCKEEAELQSLWKQAETATEAEQNSMEDSLRDKIYSQIRFITAHNDMLDETSSNAIFHLIKKEVPGAILTVYGSSTDYDILLDRHVVETIKLHRGSEHVTWLGVTWGIFYLAGIRTTDTQEWYDGIQCGHGSSRTAKPEASCDSPSATNLSMIVCSHIT